MVPDSLMVFSGNANPKLAQAVVQHLNIPLGRATVSRFSDGEVQVELNENVRGRDVFIIQPTCQPTNDNLMELVIMVDALRRASAARITAVIPYYGYARQDRRPRSTRVAISAKVVANMLQAAGTGIAVGNAVQEVKEAADGITRSNDEEGVAVYIENNVLDRRQSADSMCAQAEKRRS
jgi:ribose-phosphate pyrophosphokinase